MLYNGHCGSSAPARANVDMVNEGRMVGEVEQGYGSGLGLGVQDSDFTDLLTKAFSHYCSKAGDHDAWLVAVQA